MERHVLQHRPERRVHGYQRLDALPAFLLRQPSCSSGYYYVYNANYKWNGFALGASYYARTGAGAAVTYDVMKIAPEPDTYAPTITHTSLADSYARSRTVTATIADGEFPAAA